MRLTGAETSSVSRTGTIVVSLPRDCKLLMERCVLGAIVGVDVAEAEEEL
jgi:hypothetical protein